MQACTRDAPEVYHRRRGGLLPGFSLPSNARDPQGDIVLCAPERSLLDKLVKLVKFDKLDNCFIDIETECNCSATRNGGEVKQELVVCFITHQISEAQAEKQNICINDFHRMNCNPRARAAGARMELGDSDDCDGEGRVAGDDRGSHTCYLRCRSNSLQSLFPSYNDVFVWPRSAMYKVREDARLREQDFGNYQDPLHVS
eukprot:765632-Hanusia_phi.AAC.5